MNILYAVPWIEIEYGWGDRPEGYRIFSELDDCIKSTIKSSENGNYDDGYFGPERPLHYYEIPYEEEIASQTFVDKLRFKSNPIYIK